MYRKQFIYNKETCKYEPYAASARRKTFHICLFLICTGLVACGMIKWYLDRFDLPHETMLAQQNNRLKVEWELLIEKVNLNYAELAYLQERDDHNYRVILDKEPIPQSVRQAGFGGRENLPPLLTNNVETRKMINDNYIKVEKLKRQVEIQTESFKEIRDLLEYNERKWASRPAIQPINNKELTRLHTTYGLRFHPHHNAWMEHKGLDFTAPYGTPVYATGDGIVTEAYRSTTYGNVIFIDHNFDFETRYAHLSNFKVEKGQKVKRGEIIGYVGSTGVSTAPHLHYEIWFKGKHVNPINFFQRDLRNEEYERLIDLAGTDAVILD
jgi:murein DD-endopeptidase MepM/ murein hydrolase activator NlpD